MDEVLALGGVGDPLKSLTSLTGVEAAYNPALERQKISDSP